MQRCDVVIAGGGPAGSSCAWKLRQGGLDVTILDRARFPRDKVCAGWITPPVISGLALDMDDYRRGRTFQPLTAFVTGIIGSRSTVRTEYGRAVSYGIRRCEFDHYLLERSGVKCLLGTAITTLRRHGRDWVVNDTIVTPLLIGAGGHFCPVARMLNGSMRCSTAPVVVAQEVEFALDRNERQAWATEPECPELYFSRDMNGYGWCVCKGGYLNVGFGQLETRGLRQATSGFIAFLEACGRVPRNRGWNWRGHAYALNDGLARRVVSDGVLLVGDAAGLAYRQSGEGIRPAVESGLLAASTILQADGRYTVKRLAGYERRLRHRFPPNGSLEQFLPAALRTALAARLLRVPAFVRHVVLDRWFLHDGERPLAA
jgi:flavin-dependent dehydrogenase